MSTIYRSAIIGVGRAQHTWARGGGHQIGYAHTEMYRAHPRAELVAGADINAENLAAWLGKFPGGATYANHQEMLERERPDIVSICTYVGLHRTMIEDCARAGVKGIFCEKPFVASPADIAAVSAILAETGVKIIVAHLRRHGAAFGRIRELIAGGAIGRPLLFSAGIAGWDLSEWGSHWLDMFRFFNGDEPVRWVMGQARVREARGYGHAMEDRAVAYFEFANGAKGLVDGGKAVTEPFTMILTGTEGEIRLAGEERIQVTNGEGRREEVHAMDYPLAWRRSLDSLVEWMDGGAEPMLGATNMRGTSELNLGAYLSARRGDRVDLPLEDCSLGVWPLE